MYALKNKVQLIGNLGNAPEVRNTESGKKLVRFSVATNESYRNAKGEKVTETQWHNLIAVSYTHLDVYKRQIQYFSQRVYDHAVATCLLYTSRCV